MERKDDIDRFLNGFMSCWYLHKADEPRQILLDTYWQILSKYSIEQVESSFAHAMAELKWFPKPVELRRFIDPIPDAKCLAHQQAGYLVAMLQGVGYRNPKGWDEEPTTKRLLDGQFRGIYERAKESDIKWIEKDFINAYNDIADYVETDEKLTIEAAGNIKQLTRGIG